MLGLCEASPSPEIASGEVSAGLSVVRHEGEDVFVVSVAPFGGAGCGEGEPVARIAELLHDERFLDAAAYGEVFVDVLLGVLARHGEVFGEVVGACPTPVVWPKVYVAVVHVLVGADALVAVDVVFASPAAFTANADEVFLVQRTYECTGFRQPFFKGRQCAGAEGTRLVAYLP